MAISNFTFTRIYNDLYSRLLNAKISKIIKISNTDFSFYLFSNKQESLIFSFDNSNPYMLISSSYFKMIQESTAFVASLKKYFEGGKIIALEKLSSDKVVTFTIRKLTASYQTITNKLIVELIPYRPNAIIVNEDNVIIDCIKKSSSLDEVRPLQRGLHYQYLNLENKEFNEFDTLETIKTKVIKTIYNEIEYRVNNGETIKDIVSEINSSTKYYNYKNDIVSIPLKSVTNYKEFSLDELSSIYEEKENEKYKKSHYELVLHTINHKLKGLKNKLVNLNNDLKKAEEKKDYIEIGNLLFMNLDAYTKGQKEIVIEGRKIPLDDKLDLVGNANKYFKLYQKSKVALEQVNIQINLTKDKIEYFEKLSNQVKYASVSDMEDIITELKEDGYIKKEKNQNNKKKKQAPKIYSPHYIISSDNEKIGFGLSSYQNEYLTFELARKDDYFLHAKDVHGPHVIIFSSSPSKETILLASEIALYLADLVSGEVIVTDRKCVKKVPAKRGLVTFNNYETITLNEIRESSVKLIKECLKK